MEWITVVLKFILWMQVTKRCTFNNNWRPRRLLYKLYTHLIYPLWRMQDSLLQIIKHVFSEFHKINLIRTHDFCNIWFISVRYFKKNKTGKEFFFVYFGHSVKEFFTLFWEHNLRLYPWKIIMVDNWPQILHLPINHCLCSHKLI